MSKILKVINNCYNCFYISHKYCDNFYCTYDDEFNIENPDKIPKECPLEDWEEK